MTIQFEWDSVKAEGNLRKHGVTFAEASTVFRDPLAVIFDDNDHSEHENREIIIGHSLTGRLVIVSFVERRQDHIRLISAREVTSKERNDYETHR